MLTRPNATEPFQIAAMLPAGIGLKPRYAGRDRKQERCRWPGRHFCDMGGGGQARPGEMAATPAVTATVRGLSGDSRSRDGFERPYGTAAASGRPVGRRVIHRAGLLRTVSREARIKAAVDDTARQAWPRAQKGTTKTRISRISQLPRMLFPFALVGRWNSNCQPLGRDAEWRGCPPAMQSSADSAKSAPSVLESFAVDAGPAQGAAIPSGHPSVRYRRSPLTAQD